MSYETIKYEKSAAIATITFNRPDKLNALNDTMQDELMGLFDEVAGDDDVRVLVFAGAGKAFSAGADIGQRFLEPIEKSKKGETNLALMHTFTRVGVSALKRIGIPIIAMVNGAAVGFGCTLSLVCDIRIASRAARFGLGFVRLGVTPEFGSTYFLPRLVGLGNALELLFTGKIISAEEAKEIGMVNRVVSPEQLEKVTYEMAETIAQAPPVSIRMIKRGIYQGIDADLESQVLWEHLVFNMARQTEDHLEGINAFLEKRDPRFRGR